ncbi:MAG TPA: ABC transporter substrate-binding protein [Rhodospirillaceae bacterium]|jgi:microcin C transport system substrate-binding protein|nr:ABC transporter substrate-binding protein [Alphaproteobacteria bacterium]HBH27077.1 ABC transporter substrate-binding protein [Rhodospirillaceae bacterium]
MRLLLALLLLAAPALGAEGAGLAMHGAPKYGPSDTHFAYVNPRAPKGGTLRLTTPAPFDTLNPFAIGGVAAPGLGEYAYARLTARAWDEPFTLYPLIADRLEVPQDRSSLTVHIREGATFSDGAPITAQDVLFSFHVLRDHGRPNMRSVYALARAEALDGRTVRFTLHGAYTPETVMILAMLPVLQQKWWAGRDFSAPLTDAPPTPGPYRIAAVDMGRSITYVRVQDWWGADLLPARGQYNFDTITYRVVRDDVAALAALAKGEVDWRREGDIAKWQDGFYGDAVREVFPHGRAETARGIVFNLRRPPLDDARVREALGLLLDADWVNRVFYRGAYTRTRSIFPNTDLAAAPPVTQAMTKRQVRLRAADLLDAAGFPVGPDGQRGVSFTILVSGPRDEAMATAYARMAARAGIQVSVRRADPAVFARRLQGYDYDAVLTGWTFSLSPGAEMAAFWSCAAAEAPGRFNYAGVCDPQVDALVAVIPRAATREALIDAAHALDAALAGQYFWAPLFHAGADRIARQPWIRHPEIAPLYAPRPIIETWWMDAAAQAR